MNKKGFTLIELIVVVGLLAIIVSLFVPNTIKILKENNLKIYKIKEEELLKACKDYARYDDSFEKLTEENPIRYVTMDELVDKNYMAKIIDTTSGNECKALVKVTLNSISGYDYEVCLVCDEYTSDKSFCNASIFQDM